jgi:Family of unknown function (DUF6325)
MGPVDYLVVKFPGNQFSGEIAPELTRLEKNNIIRILDLTLVLKDEKGNVRINEANEVPGEVGKAFRTFAERTNEWFSVDDIEAISASLPRNSSAGILLYENTWAVHFKEALLHSKAELIDMGRIPPELVQMAEQKLIAQGGLK